jgi:hypothetical protein
VSTYAWTRIPGKRGRNLDIFQFHEKLWGFFCINPFFIPYKNLPISKESLFGINYQFIPISTV